MQSPLFDIRHSKERGSQSGVHVISCGVYCVRVQGGKRHTKKLN